MSIHQEATRLTDAVRTAPAEPHLFRFGLRQLLLFVAGVCLLLAAMAAAGGAMALVLLLATAVLTFHIFSTALATQLRSHTDRTTEPYLLKSKWIETRPDRAEIRPPARVSRSPWHARASTPLPWLVRLVVAMSLFGGVLGAVVLTLTMDRQNTLAGIVLGSVSFAIVAAWVAFIGYSFCRVFRHGVKQAMADDQQDSPA